MHDTQIITATVTDNGQVASVSLTVGGVSYPMAQHGSEYDYSWQVNTIGEINFTIVATDTAGNQAQLPDSFTSQARDVDVCTWKGCKIGAESWSNDDGNNACRSELETAGFRGTYYYNGASTLSWFADYTAAGHEIASHTVGHPCNAPCCSPNCTPETLSQCPYTESDVTAYRQDQLEPNIAAIEAGTGTPVLSLAWPCGCTDPGRMEAATYYYLGARGYFDYIANLTWLQDVNQPTPVNLYNLNTANSYNQSFIDRAASEGTWATVTSHGSCAGIDYMGSRQDVLWAAPVGEVLKYIYVRDHTQFSNYSRAGRTISFDAVHSLSPFERRQVDDTILTPISFDNPVTLKVHILASDTVQSVEVNGNPIAYTIQTLDGAQFVLFDTPLDTSRHVVINLAAQAPTIQQVTDNSPVELGQPATISAVVTIDEGSVQSVNLHVLTPQAADYPMSLVPGMPDTYTASFVPASLGDHSYQVTATNDEGTPAQSEVRVLQVQDTTLPAWSNLAQAFDSIPAGETITLSADAQDMGGLAWAILATDESGTWQEFNWPMGDWWDHDWAHRVPVVLTESAGIARTAETVDILVSTDQFPGLTSCAAELRVADTARQELPIQVYGESSQGGTLTCNLLFQASLVANASQTYYIYYGNPTASPPNYTTDLTSNVVGGLATIHNNYFDLDLDVDGGVISRMRLPQGSNANLPLSPESDYYWGWHQVCSSLDGNITGKNRLCVGGVDPATGLSLATTLDGPIMKEYTFTSVKGAATYTIVYRFYANSPYYEYQLTPAGTSGSVMDNFWYSNGYFARLGAGTGGIPVTTYNTYSNSSDQVRMASFTPVDFASIDGLDNDGTELGGTDYIHPTAPELALWVTTGATQSETEFVLSRLAEPVAPALGALEDVPATQYGSPMDLNSATSWTPAAFTWQNLAIPTGTEIQWRIKFCDLSDNCASTDVMVFSLNTAPVAVDDSYTLVEGQPLVVTTPGVLGNDTDIDGDGLTAVLVDGPTHGDLDSERRRFIYLHANSRLHRSRQLHVCGQRRDSSQQ